MPRPPVSDATTSAINHRVTFSGTDGATFGDIHFFKGSTAQQAFEIDNVSFTAAILGPATWGMMLVGFAMVGAASRYRRPSAPAVLA